MLKAILLIACMKAIKANDNLSAIRLLTHVRIQAPLYVGFFIAIVIGQIDVHLRIDFRVVVMIEYSQPPSSKHNAVYASFCR